MGHWGVKSYENDRATDALDAGFERVHGDHYEELMDDRNPLSYEQVQQRLADSRTLEASIAVLAETVGEATAPEAWDEETRLALAGIVVRHAELKVAIPEPWRQRVTDWLEREEIDWHEATVRRLRRQKELDLLQRAPAAKGSESGAGA